jgi:predicted kinase
MKAKLILIRGLPGSGKSTIARSFHDAGYAWFEADMFHLNEEGDYCYNPDNIKSAHEWCQNSTLLHLKSGLKVVVSNTFTRRFEMEPYFKMARELGIEPNVIEAKGTWQNDHGVPESVIEKMRKRWEEI